MGKSEIDSSPRAAAHALMRAIDVFKTDNDAARLRTGILDATRALAQRADLLQLGVKRQANHIDNSRWLYYDGDLQMSLDEFPMGKFIPPHDHGIWEALVVVRGRMGHSVYERADDGKVEGHATLRVTDDGMFVPGEIAMVVPPSDIHSFKAAEAGTYVITVVGGEYSALRHYYRLDDNTYTVRTPRALREAGVV
jgi:predicted metal-dependent enzyme (double-stranded beta helix superfamily)